MPLIFTLKAMPRSGKNCCRLDKSGQLKWYLKSAPEKGQANKELIKSIAKALGIPQAAATIIAGATTRVKTIQLDVDYSLDTLLQLLGVSDKQRSFL